MSYPLEQNLIISLVLWKYHFRSSQEVGAVEIGERVGCQRSVVCAKETKERRFTKC